MTESSVMVTYFVIFALVSCYCLFIYRLDQEVHDSPTAFNALLWVGAVLILVTHYYAQFLLVLIVPPYLVMLVFDLMIYGKDRIKALYMLFYVHPAKGAVEASAHPHPTNLHKELDAIMESQEVDDQRAQEIIHQMNPWQQFVARARYDKRMKEAKRLRLLLEKREQALREEGDLADQALETERTKRGRR